MYTMFLPLLQALDVSDVSGIANIAKELTPTGIIMVIAYILYKRLVAQEEKTEEIRKQKDALGDKNIELLITNQRLIGDNNKLIDEITKLLTRLEKLLDK